MTAVRTRALPWRFFDLSVARAERIGHCFARITFQDESLKDFVSSGRDQRIKLFFPQPGHSSPVVPTSDGLDWFDTWRAMDPATRAILRTYTVREFRPEMLELDVDFALHGDHGPASAWALRAKPGDHVVTLGPTAEENGGADFQLPEHADWTLITGDESALPAIAGILSWLPSGMPTKVWIEIDDEADRQHLPTDADADITWLVRDDGLRRTDRMRDAVMARDLPAGSPYAFIAGESGSVRTLRRHLVGERGFDRRAVKFTGYWRLGAREEDLIAESIADEDKANRA